MPPKQSKKERDKAEKRALEQLNERQDMELDEEKARQLNELSEQLQRYDILVQHYATLVNPQSRLMVYRTSYDELRQSMQKEGTVTAERVVKLQSDMRRHERESTTALQLEIIDLKNQVRVLSKKVNESLEQSRQQVSAALLATVRNIDDAVAQHRSEVGESGHLLCTVLEQTRESHAAMLLRLHEQVEAITRVHIDNTSMHTRIPPRIRKTLQSMDKDQLIVLLDTLSFEDSVVRHLRYTFPPGPDTPF